MENQEQSLNKNQTVVTIGDWIITMILICIPVVNLILLLIRAFSSSTSVSKANRAKAILIFMVIGILIMILFRGIPGTALGSM